MKLLEKVKRRLRRGYDLAFEIGRGFTANEIIPHLFLGDVYDAFSAPEDFAIVCVMDLDTPRNLPKRAHRIPIMKDRTLKFADGQVYFDTYADPLQLDVAADVIDKLLKSGKNMIVHCAAGIERSALTTVWFLHKKRGLEFNAAYKLVKQKRPIIAWRAHWLPRPYSLLVSPWNEWSDFIEMPGDEQITWDELKKSLEPIVQSAIQKANKPSPVRFIDIDNDMAIFD